MSRRTIGRRLLCLLVLVAGGSVLAAQRFGGCNGCAALDAPPNPKYDGRFTYARIKFNMFNQENSGRFRSMQCSAWP